MRSLKGETPLGKPDVTLGAAEGIGAGVVPEISGDIDADGPDPQVVGLAVLHVEPGHGVEGRLPLDGGEVVPVAPDAHKLPAGKRRKEAPALGGDSVIVVVVVRELVEVGAFTLSWAQTRPKALSGQMHLYGGSAALSKHRAGTCQLGPWGLQPQLSNDFLHL